MSIYSLNGAILYDNEPFYHQGIKYSSVNSLTSDQRTEIGIVEVPEYPNYNKEFWWGMTPDGNYIPKKLNYLVDKFITKVNTISHSLLSDTDWMIIREIDSGVPVPDHIKVLRQQIRDASNEKIIKIKNCINVGVLAQYISSSEFNEWPMEPKT